MMRVFCGVCLPFEGFIIAIGLVMIGPGTSWGGIAYYDSKASFDAAAPGLPVDTFPGTGVSLRLIATCQGCPSALCFRDLIPSSSPEAVWRPTIMATLSF